MGFEFYVFVVGWRLAFHAFPHYQYYYIYISLSRRAIDQNVKEGMEAKAEQAGNLAHDRNDREAFRLVGELSGNRFRV